MKILFTSDLHLHYGYCDEVLRTLMGEVERSNPDVLAISGDVSDMGERNAYLFFSAFDLPVVFCLGNHEFVYDTVDGTLGKYRAWREQAAGHGVKNAHCLDIEGHFDACGVRFYGNVLWYDGSLYNGGDPRPYLDHIWERWLDCKIRDFDPVKENRRCVEQIKAEQRRAGKRKSVLLTHCVPLRGLNRFDEETPLSIPNCYSGMHDLFGFCHVHPDAALCGHTHMRANLEYHYKYRGIEKDIMCLNSGNDYYSHTGRVVCDEVEI